jgi:hypothetical protein
MEFGGNADERFLHEIFRQRPVAGEHDREAECSRGVLPVQAIEQGLGAHVEARKWNNRCHGFQTLSAPHTLHACIICP